VSFTDELLLPLPVAIEIADHRLCEGFTDFDDEIGETLIVLMKRGWTEAGVTP